MNSRPKDRFRGRLLQAILSRVPFITMMASLLMSQALFAQTAKPFVHPGLLHSGEELAFIKQKLASGEEPWKSAWEKLQSSKGGSLTYTPNPVAKVVRGVRNNPNIGSTDMSNDSTAAYSHALQWSLTEKKAHAAKAIEILNVWSATLESVSGHDAKLLIGMDGVKFCNAAELIRHTSDEWQVADQSRFERMLRHVFYPVVEDFYPTANGNWDASMIQTMIAMGIFLDDRAMFDRAVEYYRHGKGNGAIEKYLNAFGECQESGRDQLHVQMGIGFLASACEMAWKQGVDLYGASDNRLALGFEYTAKYNLGEDVPYERYRSVEGRYDYPTISRRGRGRFRPIYERIVHHYHDRMGLQMPYSRRVADKERPEGSHNQHMPWGTLTSFGLPNRLHPTAGKPRVIVSTDIGGGDPDDFQSMVHYLVYSDRFDTEGLVSSPPQAGRAADIIECLDTYEKDFENLRTWSPDYPSPQALRQLVRQGATDSQIGKTPSSDISAGAKLIVTQAKAEDERPLYVIVWGSITDVAQAVHSEPTIKTKLRVYSIGSWNTRNGQKERDYLFKNHPDLWWIESDTTFRGMYMGGDQQSDLGNRTFPEAHIAGHGELGALFMRKKPDIKMGDSPSVLYLLHGNPNQPHAPHWGGAYARPNPKARPNYWHDDQEEIQRFRDRPGANTVNRWREAYLRDWQQRMDRLIKTKPTSDNDNEN